MEGGPEVNDLGAQLSRGAFGEISLDLIIDLILLKIIVIIDLILIKF